MSPGGLESWNMLPGKLAEAVVEKGMALAGHLTGPLFAVRDLHLGCGPGGAWRDD